MTWSSRRSFFVLVVTSMIAGCPGGELPDAGPPTLDEVNSGFEPDTHGFSFANYPSGEEVAVVDTSIARRLFGEQGLICPPMPVAYRASEGAWRRGTLRFTEDGRALGGRGGLWGGPWLRGNLDLGVASTVTGEAADEVGREGLIEVPVSYGTSSFALALDEQHYTALRAWVEAVPPGWMSSNVA